jgi:hypothetical protein
MQPPQVDVGLHPLSRILFDIFIAPDLHDPLTTSL